MMNEEIKKIVELGIDIDNAHEDLFEELGVDVISIVEHPAIEESFMYFSTEEFESYSDYPEAVRNNAKRGIELNEANGNKCATQTGKVRAQQLANGENISVDTIQRMYSYLSRAEVYYDEGDTEACGTISYLLWGGKAALRWSESKLKELGKLEAEMEMTEEFSAAVVDWAEANGHDMTPHDIIIDFSKEEFTSVGEVMQGLRAADVLQRLNLPADYQAEVYYRYQGSNPERGFCRAMMNLSNRGKMFTREQIEAMDRLNPQFARSGENSYSIFRWKGGKNCKHTWQRVLGFKNDAGERVLILTNPTNGVETTASQTWAEMFSSKYAFKVTDDEQRMLYGPVMVPNRMILRRDENGDPFYVYFSKKTIKKMASKFLEQNKLHNTDIEHDGLVTTDNKLVESWVSDSMVHDKSYAMGFALPAGTWYVGIHINNEATWQEIKAGNLKGFSLSGQFINRISE